MHRIIDKRLEVLGQAIQQKEIIVYVDENGNEPYATGLIISETRKEEVVLKVDYEDWQQDYMVIVSQ